MALRFGVLGTGYWAQEAHASALAAHPEAELALRAAAERFLAAGLDSRAAVVAG
jgi:predicted dehydrogenase